MILTCLAFALAASAIQIVDSRAAGRDPKVVRHQIKRHEIPNPLQRDRQRFAKRQSGTLDIDLSNNISLYYLDVTVGTPPQDIRVTIDTGSSDLWFNAETSDICDAYYSNQCDSGTYSANDSSTYEYLDSYFTIEYADGREAQGDYATDTVRLADGVELEAQQFGVVYTSEIPVGIMGIGYQINEVASESYDNVPLSLLNNGYINSLTYSIWLNDLDSSEGEIIFGGINQDKYQGDLTTLSVERAVGYGYVHSAITLDSVAISGTEVSGASAPVVILDSGASLSYLPETIVQNIYNSVDAYYESSVGLSVVDCGLADYQDTLDFTFGSATIRVPMNELVISAASSEDGRTYNPYSDVCIFGVLPSSEAGANILGDTFLRSAYVVYDLGNNEVSLAQTVFNSTSDDIVEIGSGQRVADVQLEGQPTTSDGLPTSGPTLTVSAATGGYSARPTTATTENAAFAVVTPAAVAGLGAVAAMLFV